MSLLGLLSALERRRASYLNIINFLMVSYVRRALHPKFKNSYKRFFLWFRSVRILTPPNSVAKLKTL